MCQSVYLKTPNTDINNFKERLGHIRKKVQYIPTHLEILFSMRKTFYCSFGFKKRSSNYALANINGCVQLCACARLARAFAVCIWHRYTFSWGYLLVSSAQNVEMSRIKRTMIAHAWYSKFQNMLHSFLQRINTQSSFFFLLNTTQTSLLSLTSVLWLLRKRTFQNDAIGILSAFSASFRQIWY